MKNINMRTDDFYTCAIILAIIIVMDYGFVSYYSKMIQGFQVMLFLQADSLGQVEILAPKDREVRMKRYIKV